MKKLFFISILCLLVFVMQAQNIPEGYVDLGLPSGTLWKASNESGLYDRNAAVKQFGDKIPTTSHWKELLDYCIWKWIDDGYKVTGPNGNSIILPAAGKRDCEGKVSGVGNSGDYWSDFDGDLIWEFIFDESDKEVDWSENPDYFACQGHSVRLVW